MRPESAASDPVVVTGLGHVVIGPGDPPCDPMPYLMVKKLRDTARPHERRYFLSNSFGFGGQNASALLRNGRNIHD